MAAKVEYPVKIDLNEFKFSLRLPGKLVLSLHFNSPSRRFYLSLIALVIMEMKKKGKIVPISLDSYIDQLALLNETVGGAAGSSEKANLLPRIYRKWKQALPNLEEAPLFKVLGRKKEYGELNGKTYPFTETEKDHWANLFIFLGSEENLRLKFAVDKLGCGLDDVVVIYGELENGAAWESFLAVLKSGDAQGGIEPTPPELEELRAQGIPPEGTPKPPTRRWGRWAWATGVLILMSLIALAVWKITLQAPSLPNASVARVAHPLPDKPSIAVLPFVNLNGDPKDDYISDGLTEQITTSLSSFHRLFVIARNSTFVYKGQPVKVQKVAEDLGVQYVLEGSVLKSDNKVRITAQLVDALKGHHLWGERYDREMKDFFALQDEITIQILTALKVELTEGALERQYSKVKTNNLKAYEKNYQGVGFFRRTTKEDNETARRLFEESLALDPNYLFPMVMLGNTHFNDARFGWSENPAQSIQKASEMAGRALALDDLFDLGHSLQAAIYLVKRQHDRAVAEAQRAVELNPNGALPLSTLAGLIGCAGLWDQSILYAKQSMRLNPHYGPWELYLLGRAYFMTGRYQECLTTMQQAVQIDPNYLLARVFLTASLSALGRDAEATAAARDVLRINPRFTVGAWAKTLPYKNQADMEREVVALRGAGLE